MIRSFLNTTLSHQARPPHRLHQVPKSLVTVLSHQRQTNCNAKIYTIIAVCRCCQQQQLQLNSQQRCDSPSCCFHHFVFELRQCRRFRLHRPNQRRPTLTSIVAGLLCQTDIMLTIAVFAVQELHHQHPCVLRLSCRCHHRQGCLGFSSSFKHNHLLGRVFHWRCGVCNSVARQKQCISAVSCFCLWDNHSLQCRRAICIKSK